jgi:proteasome lid subunit RPN8/RPN11
VTKNSLLLSDDLAAQILIAAARAYPNEACGLLEGSDVGQGWLMTAVHETANIADNPARHFLIDPQAQFDLIRALRGKDTRIIGCFHSHPDGVAEPSATDRSEAYESGFLYVIAAGAPDAGFTLRAYTFDDATGFTPIDMRDD